MCTSRLRALIVAYGWMLPREAEMVFEWTGLSRKQSVKRFGQSWGSDTVLYKNLPYLHKKKEEQPEIEDKDQSKTPDFYIIFTIKKLILNSYNRPLQPTNLSDNFESTPTTNLSHNFNTNPITNLSHNFNMNLTTNLSHNFETTPTSNLSHNFETTPRLTSREHCTLASTSCTCRRGHTGQTPSSTAPCPGTAAHSEPPQTCRGWCPEPPGAYRRSWGVAGTRCDASWLVHSQAPPSTRGPEEEHLYVIYYLIIYCIIELYFYSLIIFLLLMLFSF